MTLPALSNYRVLREIGSGAMGSVYEAVDTMLERPVAIKVLRPELARQPEIMERFRVEAMTLARLNHPSIATLYSFFREGDDYFMVMEFVRGQTLENLLASNHRLAPEQAVGILRQALDALGHAHALGVLHRDVKPANIMLTGDGVVKVTDFGIARLLGSSRMTREGRLIGTLEYIAPERVRGEEGDARSDLYSAGVVLFEMLSGRLPFVSDTDYGLIEGHLKHTPPTVSSLQVPCPAWLEDVLGRALAKDASARFQSAAEFLQALAPPDPALKPTRLADVLPRRKPILVGAVAALAALVLSIIGIVSLTRRQAPAPAAVSTASAPATPAPQPQSPTAPVELPPAVREAIGATASTGAATPATLAEALGDKPATAPERSTGPRTIHGVHRLYVEPMAGQLDQYIREEIRDELGKRLYLVGSADSADAVMAGSVDRRAAGSKLNPARIVKNAEVTGRVTVTSSNGRLLWASEADDKTIIVGITKHGGARKVAERLVAKLKKAL